MIKVLAQLFAVAFVVQVCLCDTDAVATEENPLLSRDDLSKLSAVRVVVRSEPAQVKCARYKDLLRELLSQRPNELLDGPDKQLFGSVVEVLRKRKLPLGNQQPVLGDLEECLTLATGEQSDSGHSRLQVIAGPPQREPLPEVDHMRDILDEHQAVKLNNKDQGQDIYYKPAGEIKDHQQAAAIDDLNHEGAGLEQPGLLDKIKPQNRDIAVENGPDHGADTNNGQAQGTIPQNDNSWGRYSEAELAEKDGQIAELNRERQAIENELRAKQERLEALRGHEEQLNQKVAEIDERQQQQQQQLVDPKDKQIVDLTREKEAIEHDLMTERARVGMLRDQINQLELKVAAAAANPEHGQLDAGKQVAALEREKRQLEDALASSKATIETLSDQVRGLTNKVKSLERDRQPDTKSLLDRARFDEMKSLYEASVKREEELRRSIEEMSQKGAGKKGKKNKDDDEDGDDDDKKKVKSSAEQAAILYDKLGSRDEPEDRCYKFYLLLGYSDKVTKKSIKTIAKLPIKLGSMEQFYELVNPAFVDKLEQVAADWRSSSKKDTKRSGAELDKCLRGLVAQYEEKAFEQEPEIREPVEQRGAYVNPYEIPVEYYPSRGGASFSSASASIGHHHFSDMEGAEMLTPMQSIANYRVRNPYIH